MSPNKALSQYLRDRWSAEEGYPGGPVSAFAQTPDGYLWIGSEKGLVRFDGLSFQLFQHSDIPTLPDGPVLGLAVDGEGALWVRLGPDLLRYRNGRFEDVQVSLKSPETRFTAMCPGTDGEIFFASHENGLMRYSRGKFETIVPIAELPILVISMAVAPDGRLWLGTREQGLYYLEAGRLISITKGLPDRKVDALLATSSRELWVSTDSGLVRWDGSELSRAGMSPVFEHLQAPVMSRDGDSNVWVGASNGLIRIDRRGSVQYEQEGDRLWKSVSALFEDRERNLWVGTRQGVERLRDSVFTTYSVSSGGLPPETNGPIYVDPTGRAWFAPGNGGLYWLKDGQVGRVTVAGLDKDVVYSIDGRKNELWLGRREGGLTRLQFDGDSFLPTTYTRAQGLPQNSIFAVHENHDGTTWAGSLSGGLSRLSGGTFKTYTSANGLGSDSISSIADGADGTMWIGTPNGLNSLSGSQWKTFTSRNGLPPGNVNCLFEDSQGVLWIGTANGLAYLISGSIQVPNGEPESLREPIFGIEEDRAGWLWIATSNHILRADREKLRRGGVAVAGVREFGLADGLGSKQGVKRNRSVVGDELGRIWFSTNQGLSFVDPGPLTSDSPAALVHLEGISADGRDTDLSGDVRIPAPHRRITLSYTGLSLAVPARVRFKYRLDGYDQDWSDATASREATYTNLPSRKYRFRVIASNSDGLWNSPESTLQFEVEPVFWQAWSFRILCVVVLAAIALGFVRLRVVQLTRQLNIRFEERLAERTRIAQELHDTLLQGFLSASMQLYVAADQLPANSPAKPRITRVLELMANVIEEGRNVLRGLRSTRRSLLDLEQAFSQMRQEFPVHASVGFRVIVDGTPRPLRPLVRDEVYLIGHEALSNAFRHSSGSEIEVELEYATSHLRVSVRDNGGGIDAQVLESGRDGHWGLSVMKERAARIGAEFRVLSRPSAGTEVELSVPGQIAFELPPDGGGSSWFSRLYSGKGRGEKPRGSEQGS